MRVCCPRHAKASRVCKITLASWGNPASTKKNGGSRKNFLVFQVGFRGVLTVARLCLGLITKKNVSSNGCRSLTALKALQSCDFVPNVWTRKQHVLTSWSARALEPGVFPEQACAMVLSQEVAITIFSRLISPNLAVQPMFKFLLLTENTKTETWTFFKENLSEIFLGIFK